MFGNNFSTTNGTYIEEEETPYNGAYSMQKILIRIITQIFFFNRDLKPKRLRNTALDHSVYVPHFFT
jgi:hypothetical protein